MQRALRGEELTLIARRSTQVFRIFQEALTNVTRHAEANHVDVRVGTHGDWYVLEVRDDGRGIALDAAHARKSLGLLGVRERARRLGGSVTVERGATAGTVLSLKVPLVRLLPPASEMPEGGRMIKVLIADDHVVVRRGLRQILSEVPEIFVGGEASNAQEVRDLLRAERWT